MGVLTNAAKSSNLPPLGVIQLGRRRLCMTMVDSLRETVPSECAAWLERVDDGVEGRVEWREAPEWQAGTDATAGAW